VKPLPSRAHLVAAENFFSLRFLFNDPAKKVVIGHFLWGLRLRSIDDANHHEVAGLDVESEFNLPIGRQLSWWSLEERTYCTKTGTGESDATLKDDEEFECLFRERGLL
jgi:hypothetical protein